VATQEPGGNEHVGHWVTPGNPPGDSQGKEAKEPEEGDQRHDTDEQFIRRRSKPWDCEHEDAQGAEHDEAPSDPGAGVSAS